MDLTEQLDPFVLDYLLDRGWLTGCDLCRVAQVAKVFGSPYKEEGVRACRAAHAARRRLTDWLALRPTRTESYLGLLVLVEWSLQLAPPEVPRGVVLYLWTQKALDGAGPNAEHVTTSPVLPLRAAGVGTDVAPDAGDPLAAPTTDAVLLAGAQLIQSAADGTIEPEQHPELGGARVRLPGEADTAEVATVGQALGACLGAADKVQNATSMSSSPQLFEARLTALANFLRDVGLHALGETALKRLPIVQQFLEEAGSRQQLSASERMFSWIRSLRGSDAEENQAKAQAGSAAEDAEQSARDAKQLVLSLTALSSSMVSRFYAQTYVQSNDTESGEALRLADVAVQLCRERLQGDESLLAEALHHYGVASASCAQVKGLGMMDQTAATHVPAAAEMFAASERALQEAIEIRERMGAGAADLLLAQSTAAKAELYYCAASANTRGAGAFDDESVESLARRSVELNRDAFAKLEAIGFGESIECATVMKDLGKVLGFSGSHSGAREYLGRSLRIHQDLLGERHVRTANVARLSRYG